MIYRIDILNPKAKKLLENLADLKLISITEEIYPDLPSFVSKTRKRTSANPPKLKEILSEVEKVRSFRHAKKSIKTGH